MTGSYGCLTREDLLTLLQPGLFGVKEDAPAPLKRLPWPTIALTALILATINVPAFWQLAQRAAPLPPAVPMVLAAPEEAKTPHPQAEAAAPVASGEHLKLAALNIDAPIIWGSPYDSQTLLTNLQSGVVQLAGTAVPGQNGTMIITGHSSYYMWSKGSYKDVFAPLTKAQLGQEIQLDHASVTYRYQITEIYEVTPDRTDLLVPSNQPLLRLITCTPVGTSQRRLIVDAKQISPDPAQNTAFNGPKLTAQALLATR